MWRLEKGLWGKKDMGLKNTHHQWANLWVSDWLQEVFRQWKALIRPCTKHWWIYSYRFWNYQPDELPPITILRTRNLQLNWRIVLVFHKETLQPKDSENKKPRHHRVALQTVGFRKSLDPLIELSGHAGHSVLWFQNCEDGKQPKYMKPSQQM